MSMPVEPNRPGAGRAVNPADSSSAYVASERTLSATRADRATAETDAVDVALVKRIARQDPDALAAFYDRWASTVRGVVQRILSEAADVDEVVEEVFWQIWQQADRFDASRGRVPVWLLTVARSRSLDRLRARKRRRDDVSDTLDDGSSRLDQFESTDEQVDPGEFADQRARVKTALLALPLEQRDVVALAYYSGLSQAEIAERLELPLGTVKTRTRLAFAKLRDSLAILWDADA